MNVQAFKPSVKRVVGRKGSALVLAVIIILVLLITGTGMMAVSQQSQVRSVRFSQDLSARTAADAGLAKAVHEMNQLLESDSLATAQLPYEENMTLINSSATYSYTITGDPANGYTILSTGRVQSVQKTVRAVLVIRRQSPYQQAILGVDKIELKNNANIQAYDSTDPLASDLKVKIGSLSTADGSISLTNNVTIKGDAFVGVGGDPDQGIDLGNNVVIEGETYALEEEIELPRMEVPSLPDQGSDLDINETTVLDPSDSGRYGDLVLGNSNELIIGGGDVILSVEDVEIRNNGSVRVLDGSSLTLYVDGDIEGSNGDGFITESGFPRDCKLITTNPDLQNIVFKNNSNLYMVLYAPNSEIEIKNNGDLYGSFTAKSFLLKNNAEIYYDVSLQEEDTEYGEMEFVITQWSEE